jgi:branched-chain amino acid transport system substrate-binding protein
MKRTIGFILSLLLCLVIPQGHAAGIFRLGFPYDGTGANASYGRQGQIAAEWAVEEINKKGGIQGSKVEIFAENTASDAQKAGPAAFKLVSKDKVYLLVGPVTSSNSSVIQQIAEEEKVSYVATVGSSDKLVMGKKEWFFRYSLAARFQSEKLVNYCLNVLKAKTFAVLASTSAHGNDQMKNFTDTVEQKGLKQSLIAVERFKDKDLSFSSQLIKIKSLDPDVLAIYGYVTDSARVATQAREMGIKSQFVGGTAIDEEYGKLAGLAAVETIISMGYWPKAPIPKLQKFVSEFAKRSGIDQPTFSAPQTWDCLWALSEALNKAPRLAMTEDKLQADRAIVRDAIASIRNYGGVSGVASFCKEATPDCRDGLRETLLIQFKEGGRMVKIDF